MTSLLEERYRRALRILPASYRAQWEEDMVATFLESAYAAAPEDPEGVEISSPSVSELASVARLAIRLHLGGLDAPPRRFAWGEAVRRVALVGLLANAVTAVVGTGITMWISLRLPGVVVPDYFPPPDEWYPLWRMVGLLWLPAYLCLVYSYIRAARRLALLGLVAEVLVVVVDLNASGGAFGLSRFCQLAFAALPVLALAAFHPTAPPVRGRPWLLALPVGVVVLFPPLLLIQPAEHRDALVDYPGLWCAGLGVAAAALVLGARTGRTSRSPHWPLAVAILAVCAFALRVTTFVDYVSYAAPASNRSTLVVVAAVEAAAALAAAVGCWVCAIRAWRRLPDYSAATASRGDGDR